MYVSMILRGLFSRIIHYTFLLKRRSTFILYGQKGFFLCLFIVSTFFSSGAVSQKDWTVEVDGKTTNAGKALAGAVITLLQNSVKSEKVTTSSNGRFKLTLKPDNDYLIVVSKEGHVSKRISFSTKNVPENKVGRGFPPFPIEVSIFEKIEGLDVSILDKPIGKIAYYKKGNNFDYDEAYTASIQARLQKLKGELKVKRKEAKMKVKKTANQDTTLKKPPAEEKKAVQQTLGGGVKPGPITTKAKAETRATYNKKNPTTAGYYLKRGDMKSGSADYEGAMEDYNKAIELDPELGGAYLSRSTTHFILQDFQSALSDCDKSIELNSDLIELHVRRALVKVILEDYQGSTQEYNKVSEIKPSLAKAYYVRGNIKYFMGDTEGSCTDLIKSGELGYLKAYTYIKQYCE